MMKSNEHPFVKLADEMRLQRYLHPNQANERNDDSEYTRCEHVWDAAIDHADHVVAELQAENAALRAKVAELEKGREWLPIEGAPRDGVTRILVLIREGLEESIQTVAVRDTSNDCWVSSWTGEVLYPPSHFMYLPQGDAK